MRRTSLPRLLTRLAVVGGLVSAGLVGLSASLALAVTSHRPLNDTRAVGSLRASVAFPIEWFGLVADLPSASAHLPERGSAPYGQVRFSTHGRWSSWQALGQDGAQAAGQFSSALVSAGRADGYQVRGLPGAATHWRAAAINTTDGPQVVVGTRRSGTALAATPCMSRADWGADESLTAWSKGTDVQAFSAVQVLTVHHTAGSNDPAQDYAATVRAIYSFHVQTNGWSDIGYQYLVDGRGTIYEGRNSGHTSVSCLNAGGDGSDFAHESATGRGVTGAHVAGYNTGNLGISLMGCFDAGNPTCGGDTTPASTQIDGLERLLAQQASRHGLDPQGTVHYVNPVNGYVKDVATISGHRDWEATACPGGTLYAALPTIRSAVAARMAGVAPATAPTAPASLTATASGGTASLAWTAPASDGGSAVTSYQLFRSVTSPVATSGTQVYSGAATSTTDSPASGTYYYAVRACNAVGCGATTGGGPVTVTAPVRITSATCSGATCTFAATGEGGLTWNFGNGVTAVSSPVSTTYRSVGTYAVTVRDSQPTTATSRVTCTSTKNKIRCTAA